MNNTIIPERSIQFSPSLAATIGVECAILLQHIEWLQQSQPIITDPNHAENSSPVSTSYLILHRQLPFWSTETIRRILHELYQLGMIRTTKQAKTAEEEFSVAICSTGRTASKNKRDQTHTIPTGLGGATKITSAWRPESDTLALLEQNGVPSSFSMGLVQEFILYWQERNEAAHAWSNKFMQHALHRWRKNQQVEHAAQKPRSEAAGTIAHDWAPNEDAVEILRRMGIHSNFIADAIPEFILYWQERDEPQTTWNSKFVTHTKRQWARYTNTLKHDTEPKPIAANWQPDGEVFDVLTLANIDHGFARGLLGEFVLYWRDRAELHHSWNTKFLQYVKLKWAQSRSSEETGSSLQKRGAIDENHRPAIRRGKTRDRSLSEDLLDRSWAE